MEKFRLYFTYWITKTRYSLWAFCMNPKIPLILRLTVGKFIQTTNHLGLYNYKKVNLERIIRKANNIDNKEFYKRWDRYEITDRFLDSMEEK